jgi:hypothetical protein
MKRILLTLILFAATAASAGTFTLPLVAAILLVRFA